MKKKGEKAGLRLNIQKTKIMTSGHIISLQVDRGKMEAVADFIFLGYKNTVGGDCSHEIKTLSPWKQSYDKPSQYIKKQKYHFVDKGPYSQSYGFSISLVCIWKLNHKEGWALKNWCIWTMVLEKTLGSPLDCKELKPVNTKGSIYYL